MIRGTIFELTEGALNAGSPVEEMLFMIMQDNAVIGTEITSANFDSSSFAVTTKRGFQFQVPPEMAAKFLYEFNVSSLPQYLSIAFIDPIPADAPSAIHEPEPYQEPYPETPEPVPFDPGVLEPLPYVTTPPPTLPPRRAVWPFVALAGGGLLVWLLLRRRESN